MPAKCMQAELVVSSMLFVRGSGESGRVCVREHGKWWAKHAGMDLRVLYPSEIVGQAAPP